MKSCYNGYRKYQCKDINDDVQDRKRHVLGQLIQTCSPGQKFEIPCRGYRFAAENTDEIVNCSVDDDHRDEDPDHCTEPSLWRQA